MKYPSTVFFILGIIFAVSLTSCRNNEDDAPSQPQSIQRQIESNMTSGLWKISSFVDSDLNRTALFKDYNFLFLEDGSINALNGSDSIPGSWDIRDANSSVDSPDDLSLFISFDTIVNFKNLNGNWDFISQGSEYLELMDVSGGNGDIDFLTFSKK